MKISLQNVGKLASADVELNGITVIAGDNDTGKSTVGKALYSVFNGLYQAGRQVETEREKLFRDDVSQLVSFALPKSSSYSVFHKTRTLISLIHKKMSQNQMSESELSAVLMDNLQNGDAIDVAYINNTVSSILRAYSIPEEIIQQKIIENYFNCEFLGDINNIFSSGEASVVFTVQKKQALFSFAENCLVKFDSPFYMYSEINLLDDPFILNNVSTQSLTASNTVKHSETIIENLLFSKAQSVVSSILAEKRLESVYSQLSKVISGSLCYDSNSSSFSYRFPDDGRTIDARNLSTGMKTFAIIKQLLSNGSIPQGGTLILDEPEIHLHPAWQLVFAELIVLLQKEFGLHILMNTHSPYFLHAIEVYSAKHGVADKCKYYLAENIDEHNARIRDVTTEIDEIYASLAEPFQVLEDEAGRIE